MNTENYINTIKELLDKSSSQLAPHTLENLRSARINALEHQRTQHSVPVLSWLGHQGKQHESFRSSKSLNWLIAALLAACLIIVASYWHTHVTEHEISEVDLAILTDDLPIHAFLD